jgi:hypothetical protein
MTVHARTIGQQPGSNMVLLPTGVFISPLAIPGASQQLLINWPHDAAYGDEATRGFDFSDADRVPPAPFNAVLWKGLISNKPYPVLHAAYKTTPGHHADADDDDDVE